MRIALPDGDEVSALWLAPAAPRAVLVLAHGAGAGMTHRSMAATADGLAERGVATLRYQFPYMEKGGSGSTRRRSPRPRCARLPPRRRAGRRRCRCSPAAARSAGG